MSRASVRVRPATTADVDALVEFVASQDTSSGSFSGKPLHDPSPEQLRQRLNEIVTHEERILLLAVDESCEQCALAGMLAARQDDVGIIERTPVLHVTHLMVRTGHRRRGVGRALLAAAVDLADDSGVDHLLSTAAAQSREGNRYLARIGFAPLVVHRIASTTTLRRTLGMTDLAGRTAVLRRARLVRAQRAGFASRAIGRGA